MKKEKSYFLLFAVIFILADQIAKYFASRLNETFPVILNIFHVTFVKNTGIIWGAFPGANSLITWLYVVVIGMLVYFYDQFPKDKFSRIMLAFVFAGVIGNFIDRIAFGYVIDFIDFRIWPVFNIADICLNVGIIGIIVKGILGKGNSGFFDNTNKYR